MKRFNFHQIIGMLIITSLFFTSCKKWIDTEINTSENSPTDVPLNLLLPSTQASLFYVLGGDHSRAPSIWMQQQAGVDRQAAAFDVYTYNESDVNNLYNTMAATVMKNLEIMSRKAIETESPHYEGVTNVFIAVTLGQMTDVWGDVPYYEAFKAEQTFNRTPRYDAQEKLYFAMDSLLVVAIEKLQAPTSVFSPTAAADLVYKGTAAGLDKYKRLAWTLRLRHALHLEKRSGLAPAIAILDNANASFIDGNANDFQFKFGTAAAQRSPRFNFESSRGDIRSGKYLVDMMNATSDPRRAAYFTEVGGAFVGSGPGQNNADASKMGTFYGAQDAIVPVVTFVEYKFIEAELRFKNNQKDLAAAAYNAAVTASLAKHGVSNADWLAANAAETAGSITLEKIMLGKYVGLYLQSEVWTDWRRTGIPSLQLAANATETQIPRRFPYPLNERLYNPNTPAGLTLTNKVWWDN
jgi:hypothetical protein